MFNITEFFPIPGHDLMIVMIAIFEALNRFSFSSLKNKKKKYGL